MAMHRIPYRRTHIFMVCPVFRIGAYQTLWMLAFVPHRQPTGLPKIKRHELFVHQLARHSVIGRCADRCDFRKIYRIDNIRGIDVQHKREPKYRGGD
jgi:hypothetical protein